MDPAGSKSNHNTYRSGQDHAPQTSQGAQQTRRGARRRVSVLVKPLTYLRKLWVSRARTTRVVDREISPVLKAAYDRRVSGNQWKSTISRGGLNQLAINKLKYAIDTINEYRPAVGGELDSLRSHFDEERDFLEALNKEPSAHEPETRKKQIKRIKNFNSVLAKHIANACKRDNAHSSQTKGSVLLTLKKRLIKQQNSTPWETIIASFDSHGSTLDSKQVPAGQLTFSQGMKGETSNVFPEKYHGGVCSATADSKEHAVNLWTSSYEKDGKPLWAGVRHGTHGAYGIENEQERKAAATVRAKESVLAALTLKPELIRKWEQDPTEPVPLNLVSTSLLTPTPQWMVKLHGGKVEARMLKDPGLTHENNHSHLTPIMNDFSS